MKKRSQLYDYLEKTGVLENGTKDEIIEAKNKYWALVRKGYRKKQRQECKSYTVFLTKAEQKDIDKIVQTKKANTTAFIKTSALQIARDSSGIDKKIFGQIRELFFETYYEIEKNRESPGQVLNNFIELEQKILSLIQH